MKMVYTPGGVSKRIRNTEGLKEKAALGNTEMKTATEKQAHIPSIESSECLIRFFVYLCLDFTDISGVEKVY